MLCCNFCVECSEVLLILQKDINCVLKLISGWMHRAKVQVTSNLNCLYDKSDNAPVHTQSNYFDI